MRLTEIPSVGEKAAQILHEEGGFQTAEAVAYAFGPDVVACEGIDAQTYLNAQRLVDEMSDLSREQTMSNQDYWCSQCEDRGNPLGNSTKFGSEMACTTHMAQCEQCPPGYADLDY